MTHGRERVVTKFTSFRLRIHGLNLSFSSNVVVLQSIILLLGENMNSVFVLVIGKGIGSLYSKLGELSLG